MSIWDARERSHGVLKSLKSSPVGAAPWPNSEWRVVDVAPTLKLKVIRRVILSFFYILTKSEAQL